MLTRAEVMLVIGRISILCPRARRDWPGVAESMACRDSRGAVRLGSARRGIPGSTLPLEAPRLVKGIVVCLNLPLVRKAAPAKLRSTVHAAIRGSMLHFHAVGMVRIEPLCDGNAAARAWLRSQLDIALSSVNSIASCCQPLPVGCTAYIPRMLAVARLDALPMAVEAVPLRCATLLRA